MAVNKDYKECEILSINCMLSASGLNITEVLWTGMEKNSVFDLVSRENYSRRLNKKQLMQMDSSMYDSCTNIHRIIWCYPADKEKAIELLKNEVFTVAKKMHNDIEKLIKFII